MEIAPLVAELKAILGVPHVCTDADSIRENSTDATRRSHPADVVVFPGTAGEVSEIVLLANRKGVPIVSRGGGVGYAGGAIPIAGGIVVAMRRMNRILEIDPVDLVAVVEPGLITAELHAAVEERGLFYPPDPASLKQSTVGGNVAHNAGGPRAFKYGVTRHYLLGLDVVLPTGELISTGGRVVKNAVGYDLTDLFCGSEGTLGIITKIIFRLLPRPAGAGTLMALYPSVRQCAESANRLIEAGIIPSKLEFVDRQSVSALRSYIKAEGLRTPVALAASVNALLLVELDGDASSLEGDLRAVTEVLSGNAVEIVRSDHGEEIWELRRYLSPAVARIRPDKVNEDIVVPRRRVPDFLAAMEQLEADCGLPVVCFGHIGDGNIHVNLMLDASDPDQRHCVEGAKEQVFQLAVGMGGTISGEHGIGIMKAPFLPLAVGPASIKAMKAIKRALDPNGIMNPGKIFP
jgi:glycolate oxidase